jgi:CRP-like cAMP-binding protein
MGTDHTDFAEQRECNRLLAECSAFARMSPQVRAAIAALMKRLSFAPGDILMRQGDHGDALMVLSKGKAAVVLELPDQDDKLLRTVSRSDVVGEMALITRPPRTATVRAEDAVEAFVLPADAFEDLANRHMEVTVVLTDLLSDRLGTDRVDALDNKLVQGYRVEGCLARGAMAIVYEAVKEGTEDRFALKMMDHRLVYNSDALARFQQEATIAETLSHPNLVKVFGRFEHYRTFFLVMEYCDGPSLAQLIETAGPLPESVVRKILGQVFAGLTYLHESGTTHRDIKLSNVLSCQDGTLKLADFGLARPRFEPHLTDAGMVLGTPAYMAPEQFEGKEVDSTVDFYAMGCLAYELLTGVPLFDEPSLSAMITRKMSWSMPERSAINADISDELYDVLQKTLSNDPADRLLSPELLGQWAAPLASDVVGNAQWNAYSIARASTVRVDQDDDKPLSS